MVKSYDFETQIYFHTCLFCLTGMSFFSSKKKLLYESLSFFWSNLLINIIVQRLQVRIQLQMFHTQYFKSKQRKHLQHLFLEVYEIFAIQIRRKNKFQTSEVTSDHLLTIVFSVRKYSYLCTIWIILVNNEWDLEAISFDLSSGCDNHTQWFWSHQTRLKEKPWNKIAEKSFSKLIILKVYEIKNRSSKHVINKFRLRLCNFENKLLMGNYVAVWWPRAAIVKKKTTTKKVACFRKILYVKKLLIKWIY